MEKQATDALWYEKPASIWYQALPIGNGRLRAIIKGTTNTERLSINEDSFWYGGLQERTNPSANSSVPEIRKLLDQRRNMEAETMISTTLTSMPQGMRHYEPLGDVFIHFGHGTDPEDGSMADTTHSGSRMKLEDPGNDISSYRRDLVLNSGLSTITYSSNGVKYVREYFASVVDEVVCVRISANCKIRVNFQVRLNRGDHKDPNRRINTLFDTLEVIKEGLVLGTVDGGRNAVESFMSMKVRLENEGRILSIGDQVEVLEANSALLLIAGETKFRHTNARSASINRVERASLMPWSQLLSRHTSRFSSLYDRVHLNLGPCLFLPTGVRLCRLHDGYEDNDLLALLFQYERYFLISSSLTGLLANLQGIWNPHFQPFFSSKFTVNINMEMNYWPAEVTNLSEYHTPFLISSSGYPTRERRPHKTCMVAVGSSVTITPTSIMELTFKIVTYRLRTGHLVVLGCVSTFGNIMRLLNKQTRR